MERHISAMGAFALMLFSLQAAAAGSNQENTSIIGVPAVGITNMADETGVQEPIKMRAAQASSSGIEIDSATADSNYASPDADTRTGPSGQSEKRQGTLNASGQGEPEEQGAGGSSNAGEDIQNHGYVPDERANKAP